MKVFLIGCVLILGATRSANSQSSFIGAWAFDITSVLADSQARAKYDSLPEASMARVSEIFGSRTFTFFDDGRIEIAWLQNGELKKVNGVFSFEETTKVLAITIAGRETKFEVLTLTNLDLVLADASPEGLFHQLCFKKFE